MKIPVRRRKSESGQAAVLVALGISVFLLAAMGLAIDGSHLYAQRQLAQSAADAAAQAGIMSIFDSTNGSGTHQFAAVAGTTYTCSNSDSRLPCYYAQTLNKFNVAASDTVTYTPNPSGVTVPNLSSDPINLLQVTVTRNVPTTLMQLLGWSTIPVAARGTAAIVTLESPVPIIVTHPTLAGSFSLSGTGTAPKITICGGPPRSVQVNSSAAISASGNPVVDLSHAGPSTTTPPTSCSGAGGQFGNFGTPSQASFVSSPIFVLQPGASSYIHASPLQDPLLGVSPPTAPATAPAPVPLANGAYGCPSAPAKSCTLYFPGQYTTAIDVQNSTAVFAPGIYYMNGSSVNFRTHSNGYMQMAAGLTDSSTTASVTLTAGTLNAGGVTSCCGTNQGWDGTVANGGMLVYMTGPSSASGDQTGQIIVGANGSVSLIGAPSCPSGSCAASPVTSYEGILFFVDRSAAAQSHTLDGGGGLTLIGTLYAPETVATMTAHPTQYQTVNLQGNAGSATNITGEIIVSALSLGGTPGVTMTLSGLPFPIRQVALVQ